jgi:CHAT domain-containing protein
MARKSVRGPSSQVTNPLVLAIAEPNAEANIPLPNAMTELDLIEDKMQARLVPLNHLKRNLQPRSVDALVAMKDAYLIHLACHGVQDRLQPLQSGFLLRDGRLTISDIMQLKLENTLFAFLASCESAAGDREQPDEAIHLGAAMLFMGVKSIVGTLWLVRNRYFLLPS